MNARRHLLHLGWLGVALLLPALGHSQFTFATNANNTLTITGYTGSAGDVTIPSASGGMPVVAIGTNAFAACGLTSVVIPDSVTNLGKAAFERCSNLTSVVLPNQVASIGLSLFADCSSLGSATLPDSVLNLDVGAFYRCSGLTNVTFSASLTNVGSSAFAGCPRITRITLPDSVTRVGPFGFAGCVSLVEVTISTRLTTLSRGVFYDCRSLTNLTIPDGVTNLESEVFKGTGLTSITLPKTVMNLEAWALGSNTNLTNILVAADNPLFSSRDGVLFDKSQTRLLACPDGWSGSYAIPAGVTAVSTTAFGGGPGLREIEVPASVTNLEGAFYYATNLSAITVAADNAVYSSLDGVLFNHNQTRLYKFPGGKAGGYTIPETVTCLASQAFRWNHGLTNVVIPDWVTNLGYCTFSDCTALISATLGNQIYYVPEQMFTDCPNLQWVMLGRQVTFIGSAAFAQCPRLTALYFQTNAPYFGLRAFIATDHVTACYLPDTTGWTNQIIPVAVWLPAVQSPAADGSGEKDSFGFNIHWAGGQTVLVEASTNLVDWRPLQTNTLASNVVAFHDPAWTNYAGRYYRVRAVSAP